MSIDKSDGLLAKHSLLIEIIRTAWATKLDHKIAAEILERYMSKHGNARVSLRYLERATGATRPNIIASLHRLTEGGAFGVIRPGEGTRPTEYGPNFSFSCGIADDTSCGIACDTSDSGIVGDTTSSSAGNTAKRPSGTARNTESHLQNPLTSGVTVNTSAPGSRAGLAAAGSRASVDRVMRITASAVEEDEGEQWLNLTMTDEYGAIEPFAICLESNDQGSQVRGQARLEKLKTALGLDDIDDPADVVGIPFMLMANDNFRPMESA